MQFVWKDKFIDVFLCMSFLALSIVAIFFMKEVINQYASNDTGLKQSEINITQYPAVTICLKGNVTYDYGPDFTISLGDFKLKLGDDEYEVHDSEYDYYEKVAILFVCLLSLFVNLVFWPD